MWGRVILLVVCLFSGLESCMYKGIRNHLYYIIQ